MTCDPYQLEILSAANSGVPLSRETRTHVDGCPECAACLEARHELDASLRGEVGLNVPAELHERIMRNLAAADVPANRARWSFARLVAAAAAAFALLVAGLAVVHRAEQHAMAARVASDVLAEYEAGVRWAAAEAPALVAAPLDQEMSYLAEDVDRAARFLIAALE